MQTDLPMSSVPTGLFGAIAAPSMYLRRHMRRGVMIMDIQVRLRSWVHCTVERTQAACIP